MPSVFFRVDLRPLQQIQRSAGQLQRRWVSGLSLFSLTMLLILSGANLVSAQLPFSIGGPAAENQLPSGVERLGTIETAPVYFENRKLFQVVAPTVLNRSNPGGQILVEVRADQIQNNLQRIIDTNPDWMPTDQPVSTTAFDPKTLQVNIASLGGQTLLQAIDRYHDQAQDLMTVTELDAKYYGLTIPELALRRQQQLRTELFNALEARQPESVLRHLLKAGLGLAITVASSLVVWFMQRLIRRRSKTLRVQKAEAKTQANSVTASDLSNDLSENHGFHFLSTLRNRFGLERRHSWNALIGWLLFCAQISVWIVGVTYMLSIFPLTQAFAGRVWATPIALVLVLFGTGALNRLGDVVINRFSRALEDDTFFTFEDMQRRCLRISTLIQVAKGVKTFCVVVFGLFWALTVVGVPTSSVLTIGAAIALAVSLASQSLIKDLVNGILILCEDQYGIGDFIAVGNVMGLVENMNLRITQLRNAEGRLITIPNSLIAQVENLTRTWSRVDFSIEVAYDSDLNRTLTLLNQMSQAFYCDPQWQPLLVKPPEVLGIDHLSHAGALIRIWIQTQPLQQWKVGREFRLRVWTALTQAQIEIGVPQQRFWTKETSVPLSDGNQNGYADNAAPHEPSRLGASG